MKCSIGGAVALAAIASLFASCVSTAKLASVKGEYVPINNRNYTLGEPRSAYVGEPMVTRKEYLAYETPSIMVAGNDFHLSGGLANYSVDFHGKRGQAFEIVGTNEKGNSILPIPESRIGLMFGIDDTGHWDRTVMTANWAMSPIGSGAVYDFEPEDTHFDVRTESTPVPDVPYINHELVFTGIGQQGITVLYREYTIESMARPAFTQELVYPQDSKSLRFRNYLLRIIECTAAEVLFAVESE